MTIERRVTAGRVEADVVSRNLREDSLRGCLNRSRAGEFRQARLVCKGVQPLKLNPIAARGYVEGFSLCVISAVSDDVAGIQIASTLSNFTAVPANVACAVRLCNGSPPIRPGPNLRSATPLIAFGMPVIFKVPETSECVSVS